MTARRAAPTVGLLVASIALGLATRRWPAAFPAVLAQYGGDTLWAAMVFFGLALVARQASTRTVAIAALAIAYAVEVSQLYQAPWINGLRATPMGALALGQGFLWSDLLCYTLGVGLAAAVDAARQRGSAGARAAGRP